MPIDEPWSNDEQALVAALQATSGALADKCGIEITSVTRDRVEARMPVEGNTQPFGLLHGGASCVLAESLASVGSALHAWPDRNALGLELNATHHRRATAGYVTGVATPLHLGKTIATWDVRISDDEGRLVCTARVSCALVES